LSSTKEIPKIMLSKRKEIGIRIPENEVCHSILECFGSPLINTSVNIDSNELLNDPNEIEERYKNSVDLMLDSDWLPDAMESTVVRIVDNETTILREGKGDIRKLFE
jgi:tRNA threonylcarbamoyl adenosine modification protein (Sua5/YciO/YrdC/YwlC family)